MAVRHPGRIAEAALRLGLQLIEGSLNGIGAARFPCPADLAPSSPNLSAATKRAPDKSRGAEFEGGENSRAEMKGRQ
jgi:hypothetical protein